ncbi:MAG TPA: hypothetical protein VMG37_20935 [Solirubrobacteraceae bacterium]|nr:hypothetical protein [Solirubrobacteraceae bacterium]
MQRKTRRIIAAVAVIALLAAGGAAFTNSIASFGSNNDQIGYASDSIVGATATNLQYELSPDNSKIDQVLVTLQGDYSAGVGNTATPSNGSDAFVGMFNNTPSTKETCTPGSFDSGNNDTVVTCDFDPLHDQSAGEATGSATSFSLTVTSPGAQSDLTNNSGS